LHKITAAQLFDGYNMHYNKPVVVFNDASIIEAIIKLEDAGDDVEIIDSLVTPGLINTHCHIELSNMLGQIPQGTGLPHFLKTVMQQRNANAEEQLDAIVATMHTMQKNGVVAVGDICNTTLTIEAKKQSTLFCKNFIEATGFVPSAAQARMDAIINVQNEFLSSGLNATIVPHAPYSVSPNLAALINEQAINKTITYHNQECTAEDELYQTKTGAFVDFFTGLGINLDFFEPTQKSSLQSFLPKLHNANTIIMVHNSCTSNADIDFAKTLGQHLFWCLCPKSNLYIENNLPQINNFMAADVPLIIGTDSLASNDTLCIKSEVLTLQKHFPEINKNIWLQAATANGAKALGINDWAGSFEVGKRSGWVVW
jgi:aminodeoxyfutalosine deaminase